MVDRKAALSRIAVGDIFHAECPNGAGLICLTELVTKAAIRARTLPNQRSIEFDRESGMSRSRCSIDSTTPLPVEIREVLLRSRKGTAHGKTAIAWR